MPSRGARMGLVAAAGGQRLAQGVLPGAVVLQREGGAVGDVFEVREDGDKGADDRRDGRLAGAFLRGMAIDCRCPN